MTFPSYWFSECLRDIVLRSIGLHGLFMSILLESVEIRCLYWNQYCTRNSNNYFHLIYVIPDTKEIFPVTKIFCSVHCIKYARIRVFTDGRVWVSGWVSENRRKTLAYFMQWYVQWINCYLSKLSTLAIWCKTIFFIKTKKPLWWKAGITGKFSPENHGLYEVTDLVLTKKTEKVM